MEFFQASRERKHAGVLARVVGSCRGRGLVFLEIQGGEHTRCEKAEGTASVKARKRAGVEMLHETLGAALVLAGRKGPAWEVAPHYAGGLACGMPMGKGGTEGTRSPVWDWPEDLVTSNGGSLHSGKGKHPP